MIPTCPKCRTRTLEPLSGRSIDSSRRVPPSRCTDCKGVWLPHEALEDGFIPAGIDAAVAAAPGADAVAGMCPNGHGILSRASIDTEHPFHLDRCAACLGVWFDATEWASIASSQWLRHLDDLWDPVFRRKMREERLREKHLETLRGALGDELYRHVVTAAEALRDHPMKSLALAYILEETRTHPPAS